MPKPNLPPMVQLAIFAGDPSAVARDLAVLLATPAISVQTMLQSESSAYSSIEQRVMHSVTVTVVYRQYKTREDADPAAATAVLPREEAPKDEATSPVVDRGAVAGEHPGITDMPDNATEHP